MGAPFDYAKPPLRMPRFPFLTSIRLMTYDYEMGAPFDYAKPPLRMPPFLRTAYLI